MGFATRWFKPEEGLSLQSGAGYPRAERGWGGTHPAACGLGPEGVTTPALKSQQAAECQACTINLHMTLILLSVC